MAKDKLTDYDSTASGNLDVGGISVAEGMLPSGVNNAMREQMSHLADFAAGTSGVDVLKLQDDTDTNSIKLQAPASVTATTTFTLPDGDGASGQAMITDGAGTLSWAAPYGNRNLIINGAMQVWQRGTSADTATAGDYMSDRWRIGHGSLDGNVDWDQETASTPDGFGYALKVSTDASETSLDAGDTLFIQQRFEGQDLQQLQKGTSGAKSLTLSFWVKSSVASTYTAELYDADNARSISKSYAINTADTWEFKTVTFEGDTTGAFDNDNAYSFQLGIWIDAGSNFTSGTFSTAWQSNTNNERVYDTTGWLESLSPEFYITGIQLEVGETATPFEHRSYGDELARCQRYYQQQGRDGSGGRLFGVQQSSNYGILGIDFPQTMRSAPTFTLYGGNSTTGNITVSGASAGSTIAANATNSVTVQPSLMHFNWNNTLSASNTSKAIWHDMGTAATMLSYTLDAEL